MGRGHPEGCRPPSAQRAGSSVTPRNSPCTSLPSRLQPPKSCPQGVCYRRHAGREARGRSGVPLGQGSARGLVGPLRPPEPPRPRPSAHAGTLSAPGPGPGPHLTPRSLGRHGDQRLASECHREVPGKALPAPARRVARCHARPLSGACPHEIAFVRHAACRQNPGVSSCCPGLGHSYLEPGVAPECKLLDACWVPSPGLQFTL